jgi:putative SOS response-associated peptidase YedK
MGCFWTEAWFQGNGKDVCGRFFSLLTNEDLARVFGVRTGLNLPARYNIAPTQAVPVLRKADQGEALVLVPMRWGLIPGWAKEIGTTPLFNARLETAAEKPSFRGAWRHRRCIVPASGWFEWQTLGRGPKQPFAIRPADDGLLAFAGLWEIWQGQGEGSWLESVTILTQPAQTDLSSLHDRMPVVVQNDALRAWIDQGEIVPHNAFHFYPVGRAVGSVANDGTSLIEPLDGRG